MSDATYIKDPADKLDYPIDLSGWLQSTLTLTITGNPTGGTFLINEVANGVSTSAIARNATALQVQSALRALNVLGDVRAYGGPLPSTTVTIEIPRDIAGTVGFTTTDSLTGGSAPASAITSPTISTVAWTVPSGITNVTTSNTGTTATIRLSGGTDGSDYEIVSHVTATDAQEKDVSIIIEVRQREASDFGSALKQLIEFTQPDVAPSVMVNELEGILNRNKRAVVRANSTAYIVNQIMLPSPRNGHRYRCIVSGTSATTDPFLNSRWPTAQGAKVSEGTSSPALTWIEDGPEYPNIYDVRQAAYEGWMLRANKASQFIKAGDLSMSEIYDHAVAQAKYYGSLGIG